MLAADESSQSSDWFVDGMINVMESENPSSLAYGTGKGTDDKNRDPSTHYRHLSSSIRLINTSEN